MQKSKTFYKTNSTLTTDGAKLSSELDAYFDKLYNDYMNLGYSLRELTQIIQSSVTYVESKKSISFSDKYDKEERIEKSKNSSRKTKL